WGAGQPSPGRILQIAGFGYAWDPQETPDHHVVEVHDSKHRRLDPKKRYRVAVSSFLAQGGDGFSALRAVPAEHMPGGDPTDADALVWFMKSLPQPFTAKTDGRIVKLRRSW
ncbi:MAG TPA: 5'-nucleotidase C-terminal domain-containing protein, partial [Polyangiaceae bacterium]|nr:5'-nucleotidase C-terminal domain-containing protein [Polyangiaceae bacterium]